jgi:hypothetical protein
MNTEVLLRACGGPGPEFDYESEVAARLQRALGDWLTVGQCFALMFVLTEKSFRYGDGFVINDETDIGRSIWVADAAAIAASFCDEPQRTWEWFKSKYPEKDLRDSGFRGSVEEITAKLLSDPTVSERRVG